VQNKAGAVIVTKNNLTHERLRSVNKSSFRRVRKIAKIEYYLCVVLGFRREVDEKFYAVVVSVTRQ
jgi:hypothetical protein